MNKPSAGRDTASTRDARRLESRVLQLVATHKLREAIATCQQLNREFPAFAPGWYTSSQVAARAGNHSAALQAIERAIALQPEEERWQLQQASCLMSCGQAELARPIVLALDRAPRSSAFQSAQLGLLLSRLGLNERALAHYQQAIRSEPQHAEHYYNLATVQRFLGDFAAAEQALEQAIALAPSDFAAYKLRSELRRQTPQRNHVASLQDALERCGDQPRGRVQLHYALAKELEDLQRWPESFAQLRQGADQRRALMRYDLEDDLDTLRQIAAVYTPDLFRRDADSCDSPEPIFVLGLPRTGSTLVERILGMHSAVYAAGELNNFALLMSRAVQEQLPANARHQRLTKARRVALSAGVDFRALGQAYIDSTRPATGTLARFVDKMPLNFLYAGLIHLALPRAKIIHVTRHPVDTCYAIYKTLFTDAYPYSYQLEELGRYYAAYQQLMTHWETVMPGVIHSLRYEDVVADIQGSSRALLAHCELPWQEQCVDFQHNRAASTTASATQVRQALYVSSVQRWRHYETELAPLLEVLAREGIDYRAD